jgi:hypothetical protein
MTTLKRSLDVLDVNLGVDFRVLDPLVAKDGLYMPDTAPGAE